MCGILLNVWIGGYSVAFLGELEIPPIHTTHQVPLKERSKECLGLHREQFNKQ